MSTTKPDRLAAYAKEAAEAERWHDVGVALARAKASKAEKALASSTALLDAEARKEAKRFEGLLAKGEGGDWVDEFLAWRRRFAQAPAAAAAMALYEKAKGVHDPKAEDLFVEARKAIRQQGGRERAREAYREVVETWFFSGRYPIAKRWLAQMEE